MGHAGVSILHDMSGTPSVHKANACGLIWVSDWRGGKEWQHEMAQKTLPDHSESTHGHINRQYCDCRD